MPAWRSRNGRGSSRGPPSGGNRLTEPRRYVALDSLRGICACMVALFHFHTLGPISAAMIVRHGWMFVDFFFVLSGFVIASAYRQRLAEGFSPWRFVALRLGRIYPLHLAMLALLLLCEIGLLLAGNHGLAARTGLDDAHRPAELVTQLLLLNSFGIDGQPTWNRVSWSISAELWAYAVFALAVVVAGRRAPIVMLGLGAIGVAMLWLSPPHWLNRSFDLGFWRCLYGFSLGTALHGLVKHRQRTTGPSAQASLVELGVIAMILWFVTGPGEGPRTLFAPPLFALAILVFARERGIISTLLKAAPLRLLGLLSYAIYMVHPFVQARLFDALALVGQVSGFKTAGVDPEWSGGDLLLLSGWPSIVMTVLMLVFVICFAWIAHRLVEAPARAWSRQRLLGDACDARPPG